MRLSVLGGLQLVSSKTISDPVLIRFLYGSDY